MALSKGVWLNMDGDKMTDLISLNYNYVPFSFQKLVIPMSEDFRTERQNYVRNENFFCFQHNADGVYYFHLLFTNIGNLQPLMEKVKPQFLSSTGPLGDLQQYIIDEMNDAKKFKDRGIPDLINEFFVTEPGKLTIVAYVDFKEVVDAVVIKDTIFYEFVLQRNYYRYVRYTFVPKDPAEFKIMNFAEYRYSEPLINQIQMVGQCNQNNYPKGIRQITFSPTPCRGVPLAFRGRQTPNLAGMREVLEQLRIEFGPVLVEILLVNTFSSSSSITVRVDLSSRIDVANLYVKVREETTMLYGILRYPIEMLVMANVYPVEAATFQAYTSVSDFEDSTIYPNMSFLAAAIGGGLLSGAGQGIGTYLQAKQQRYMQHEMIDWFRERNQKDWTHQEGMQQSMFDFQYKKQGREQAFTEQQRQYDREQQKLLQQQDFLNREHLQSQTFDQQHAMQAQAFEQESNIQSKLFRQQQDLQAGAFSQQNTMQSNAFRQQHDLQAGAFSQQNTMQSNAFNQQLKTQDIQNKFTKELVETNLDSDIRRARNAQQLAGYRTSAAVSGLNYEAGRGGLGHPDAPQGAYLMPRSVSTQTSSPTVYLTRPTGNYTGPLSNRFD